MGKNSAKERKPGSNDEERLSDAEAILRDELSSGDTTLRGVPAVLSHMLVNSGRALVTDAIVARIRGLISSLATQMLAAQSADHGPLQDPAVLDRFTDALTADEALVSHCYALAIEAQLTERLERRATIDPVLSPLMQELVASAESGTADLAMRCLAAQSRFVQCQRRMDLPLNELPAELFAALLKRWQKRSSKDTDDATAIKTLKKSYDESATRAGLLARLISAMSGGSIAALELEHAGVALFASALAVRSKQPRATIVMACQEGQAARLALSLRAGGIEAEAIERQLLLLGFTQLLPKQLLALSPGRAAELLGSANAGEHG